MEDRHHSSFAWGVGCGLSIAGAFALWVHLRDKPKRWNKGALVAGTVTLSPSWGTVGATRMTHPSMGTSTFSSSNVEVKNTTDREIYFPEAIRLLTTTNQSVPLQPIPMSNMDPKTVLTARHTTLIPLYVRIICLHIPVAPAIATYPKNGSFDWNSFPKAN